MIYFIIFIIIFLLLHLLSILSQCSTNVVYKQQLIHLLLLFFLLKCIPIWESKKNKISNVVCSWSASKVNLQGFCEALR